MEKLEEELRKMREAAAAKKLEKTNKEESKKKVEKDKEKDKKMEEKKKERDNKVTEMQYRMEWNKARDDLECDDLKDLPTSTPLPMNMFLTKDLGDVLYVMEFIKSFQEILNLDINKTFSLEKFCDCLNSKDVDGWFGRLVVSLMSALFTIHKEEITAKVLEEKKSAEIDESGEHCQIFKAAKHSLNIYGCIIQDLPLDVYSISEIVRLYFTASSGTAYSTTNSRFVQHMNKQTLFELSPDDKLEVLIQVSHQLLNTSKVRTEIEDRQEAIKITQKNLKMHQFNCMKRSKDESSFWAKKKQEECMKGFLKDGKQNDSKGDEPNSDKTDSLVRKSARSANANVIPDENFDNLPTENLDWSKISETEKSQMRDWEQRKEKELMDELRRLQVGSPAVLGFDRTHRRYWMMTCIAGILVEDESDVSFCLSRSISSPTKLKVINQAKRTTPLPSSSSTTTTSPSSLSTATLTKTNASNNDSKSEEGERSDKENVPLEDHAESQPFKCPLTSVHEQIATKGLVRWSIYNSTEQINILMNSLNQRGFRESKLLNSLKEHKSPIIEGLEYLKPTYEFLLKFGQLKQIPQNGSTKSSLITNHIQEILKDDGNMLISATDKKEEAANDDIECHLKESLVDLEDRLYAGALGKLKGIDRNEWRQYLEDGNYEAISNMPSGVNDEDEDNACDIKELDQSKELKGLMSALLQIEKMIETRFIDVHLGQQNKKSKSKQSKKKKETEPVESDDDASSTASQHGQHHRSEELHTWKASLKSSRNMSQLYLLMHVLESSVTWSKSALNARCRICRKKGDGEQMMLCDECDKGHHTYCLKPPVKVIPEGDWFCPWCRPLPAVETPRKKLAQDEDEENEDEERGVSDDESEEVKRDDEADSIVSGSNESKVEDNDDDEGEDDKTDEDCRRTEKLEISKKYFYGKKNFKKSSIENSKNHKTIPKNFNSHLNLRKNKRLSLNKCPDKKLKMKKYSSTSVIDVGRRTRTTRQNYVEDEEEEEDDDEGDFSEKDGPMNKRIQLKECIRQERRGTKRKNVFDAHPDSPCLKKRNSYVIARESITRHSSPSSSSSSYNCDPMKFCEDLVSQLMNQEDAWPFLKPVSKKDAFDYLDIIKSPMDFSTIRNKINSFKYGHHGQLIDDVRLIFRNCQEYNAVSSFFYKASQKLSDYFEKQLKQSPLSLSTKSCSIVINGKNKDSQQVNGLSNGNNVKRRKIHYTGDGDSDSNDYDGLPTKTRNLRKRS
ncbi:hypothetical protein HELRODRAFT_188966 [Helobdella robusta]|uniref:Bromodomain adjacent to zinc finger domain protein 1A n=1 Tax=Helobdella robusta TaxID=6412 RepID=T1FQI6_HELRO|nr:hypothetical protein HELRODRAFT_188966 [Helobdella robusta]ESN98959.1 hypothetical protein HELRODRAFT_188966 [Helobdella robusta]